MNLILNINMLHEEILVSIANSSAKNEQSIAVVAI